MWATVAKWGAGVLRRLWPTAPPTPEYEETVDRTAHSRLAKQSKVDLYSDYVVAQNMEELYQDDLDSVQRYREMKVFGAKPEEVRRMLGRDGRGSGRHTIIADDVRLVENKSAMGATLVALAGVGAMAAILLFKDWEREPPEPAPAPAPIVVPGTNTKDVWDYDIDMKVIPPENKE